MNDGGIIYAELFGKLVKKNIWQIQDCDECLEYLLSRKNYLNNIPELVIQFIRISVIDE